VLSTVAVLSLRASVMEKASDIRRLQLGEEEVEEEEEEAEGDIADEVGGEARADLGLASCRLRRPKRLLVLALRRSDSVLRGNERMAFRSRWERSGLGCSPSGVIVAAGGEEW